MICPTHYKLVSGVGRSKYELCAFDSALRDAGIGDFNLVKVSSILPPKIKHSENLPKEYGSILFTAYSTISIKNEGYASTAVATAIPKDPTENGVIFENAALGDYSPIDNVEKMCIEAMKQREREYIEIIKTFKKIDGIKDMYTVAVSAIVMW